VTTRPRIVFDTNVLISAALLKSSLARQALDKAIDEGELLFSLETIDELNRVLMRSDFARYVTEEERFEFLAALVRESKLIEITTNVEACRDPRDNKFLELGLSGDAKCIVSGDQDLLVLHPFHGIPILTPREFVSSRLSSFCT